MKAINKTYLALTLALLFALPLAVNARVPKRIYLEKTRVACIGNSITYGMMLADPATESYPAQLQQMLGDGYKVGNFGKYGYEVGNFGKSGATLLRHGHRPYIAQEEWAKAKAFKGDIAVIHLGVNDTDPRNWPYYRDEFVSDYLALIDTLRQENPKCRIIIALLSPITHNHPRFESGTQQWHEEIQEAIKTVARVGKAQLIDFHKPLYAYPQLIPDAVHPNKEGATMLARTVYSAILGNYGGLQMPITYSDNMVLQRNRALTIHGTANAGEKVTVNITRPDAAKGKVQNGRKRKKGEQPRRVRALKTEVQTATATADDNGCWQVTLRPQRAENNLTLTISTDEKQLVYNNVAFGEVWLCSGQSNMEFMLHEAATAKRDIPKAKNPSIRFFDMKARWRTNPVEWDAAALDSINHLKYFADTKWTVCSPETAKDFSAIAYYFGSMLQDSLQCAVGLICNAVGGSPTEAWVDRADLDAQFPQIMRNWTNNDFVQPWVHERAALNMKKAADMKLQRHPYDPCYLYESAIEPLQQFPIKGVLWYQGESNAQNFTTHERLFKLLVEGWRRNWNDAELPFYYVQLSSMDRLPWQWFRDSQRRLQSELPHVAMAVSSDMGDSLNVHPTRKQPVGERLARIALHNLYDFSNVVPSGPAVKEASVVGDGIVRLTFDYADGLSTSDGKHPLTFEIAEEEGLYKPAEARIEGNTVVVMAEGVTHPRFVRYGWQPFTRANLINGAQLPASTFRIEIRVCSCLNFTNKANCTNKAEWCS